jgi:ELWxxDGT repeat protein
LWTSDGTKAGTKRVHRMSRAIRQLEPFAGQCTP